MKNSWETVTVDDNPMGLYLSQPDGAGPFPAIIVTQNQDGVPRFTQEMTRRVARGRLYRHRAAVLPSRGRTENARGNRQLQKYPPRHQRSKRCQRDDQFSHGCANADTSRLGIVGFCMGGRIAFLWPRRRTHSKPPSTSTAAASINNGANAPRRRTLAANVSCPIQGHFGELDKNPPPDEMRQLDAELTKLGQSA